MRSMVELLNRSPADHERNSGPSFSIERAMPAQGFTAVNGSDRRQSPASPRSLIEPSTESQPRSNPIAPSTESIKGEPLSSSLTSTRNDSVLCSEPAIKLSPDTAKRKRMTIDAVETSRGDDGALAVAPSPKRRMTDVRNGFRASTTDGSALSILNTHVSIEHSTRERCSRERSPVPTRNQRVAPPQVRPETEAHLAESLATHLQDANNQAPASGGNMHAVPLPPAAPVTTRYEQSPTDAYSPGDPGDPNSKRKRNFSNRTKTGCHTCRGRKKKCDEGKPECNNCSRGGFTCTGYGAKPISDSHKESTGNSRAQVPLQSKVQDAPHRSPARLPSDGPRYDHWGRIPPTPVTQEPQHRVNPPRQSSQDLRPLQSRDVWRSSSWQPRELESPFPYNNTFAPADYNKAIPSAPSFDPRQPSEVWRHPTNPSMYSGGPLGSVSSRESAAIRNPHAPFAPLPSNEVSEKHKMLIGEPYQSHVDGELLDDRRSCMAAVERWNNAHQHSRAISDEEKGRFFKAILDPFQRPDPNYHYRDTSTPMTRPGSIGARVIVVSPFTCDYGYNIHIGDDTFIGASCTMEDAGEISIGSRAHIGKNVMFCGTDEPSDRKGSQAELTAGAIIVEDEVHIGAGTIIMPHRVIGKGASVAAGSVVTRNIPPYTVAAGNPCRVIKTLPRANTPESKRHSRELTAFTTVSSSVGSGHSEEDLFGDKQLLLENKRSLREMRARRGIRQQGL